MNRLALALPLLLLAAGLVVLSIGLRLGREQGARALRELERVALAAREARDALGPDPDGARSRQLAAKLSQDLGVDVAFLPMSADSRPAEGDERVWVALPPQGTPPLRTRVIRGRGEVERDLQRETRMLLLGTALGLLVAAALATALAPFQLRRSLAADPTLRGAFSTLSEDLQKSMSDLRRERDLLGAVLEGMADGVLVTDAASHITRTNPALREFLPMEAVEPGRTVLEATRHARLAEHIARVERERRPRSAEIEIAAPPARTFRVSSAPVPTPGGVVTVFQDVTELKRLERVRRDFVANVSHELRTPVAALQAAGETLLAGAASDPERAAEFLAIVARNAERLGALVTDLLALARLESGEWKLDPVRVGVRSVVGRVLDHLAPRIQAKRMALSNAVPEALFVDGDPRALEQVLTNLVDNAVKYTPEGGRIGIEAVPSERMLRVVVWDTGVGIEVRHSERVFERFYRVDPGRSREMGGTGLGLSIVKHLVEEMGGKVGVEPNPGGGSRFWVELPRRRSVLFACVHNAGRSQMAAALFNQMADPRAAQAVSAGTAPGERVHPQVIEAMREAGVELTAERPRLLTPELAASAALLVTMGCGAACPVVPGVERDDWPLPDPAGRPLEEVRAIREDIRARVRRLLEARGWARG